MNQHKPGRKTIVIDVVRLKTMLDMGVPKARIARDLGVGRTKLYRVIGEYDL